MFKFKNKSEIKGEFQDTLVTFGYQAGSSQMPLPWLVSPWLFLIFFW
jgi:hypothetical protein